MQRECKIELLEDVQKEMGELMTIHSDEIAARLRKDAKEIIRLRRKLAAARDRKATAIDMYLKRNSFGKRYRGVSEGIRAAGLTKSSSYRLVRGDITFR